MKVFCPKCESPIPASRLNAVTDIAICDACDEAFDLSTLIVKGVDEGFRIDEPPPGASFEETGVGWRLTASTRSAIAFFLVPFMMVWSGFSLGGIYGTQIAAGEFNLLLSLFGIPFVLGTLVFGSLALMTSCGHIVVTTQYEEGTVFSGIGLFGRTQRFDWAKVSRIEEQHGIGKRSQTTNVLLVGDKRIECFGGLLTSERRYYVVQALRMKLASRTAPH